MHVFQVAFYGSGIFYALFMDNSVLIPFFAIIAIYLVISALLPGSKDLSTRKKLMLSTWGPPSEGNIVCRIPVRVEKIYKLIESIPK